MNICLLNDSFPPVIDGVANVVLNYAKILTNTHNAGIVVGTPKYPGVDYTGYPYKVVPYKSLDTTDFIAGYRTGNPLAMREILEMADTKPDIIHTHCPASSTIMARILQNETEAPIVFTYHTKFDVDIARAVGDGFLKQETIKAMVSNISACDEVWVVSHGAGENLKSLGYEGEYRVMNNGVDFPKGTVVEEDVQKVTGEYDLPKGVPMYLFVGRMMKYKGLPLIVDAMARLSEKGVDYRMVFVGGGADAAEIQEQAKSAGIAVDIRNEDGTVTSFEGASGKTGKILFMGAEHDREKLRAWNTRADLFLFPSVYDTNGIVVREAAACGLGSVLIKDSCAAEGITHGRNGYLIEETAQSMAELLASTAGDLGAMHDVGVHAMDEIYISWDDAVKTAYDRYGEILDMVADGRLVRRKKHSSDYFLETTSSIIKGTEEVFDIPKNIVYGMKDNYYEFKNDFMEDWEDFREGWEDFKDDLHDLKHKIPNGVRELGENAKEFQENVKEAIKDGLNIE